MKFINRLPKVVLAVGALALAVIGARIGLPGVDGSVVDEFFRNNGAGAQLALYNWLVGGALGRGAILALGIVPYVSASIWIRIASMTSRRVAALAETDAGRAQLHRWKRGLTLGLAVIQSIGYSRFVEAIPGAVAEPGIGFTLRTVLTLTACSLTAMWLTERLIAPATEDLALEKDEAAEPPPVEAKAASLPGATRDERLLTAGEVPMAYHQQRAKEKVRLD